jgi:predicted nucleic acid-binding Zn finger protein
MSCTECECGQYLAHLWQKGKCRTCFHVEASHSGPVLYSHHAIHYLIQ